VADQVWRKDVHSTFWCLKGEEVYNVKVVDAKW
jgi:hypothetical protein